MKCVDKSWMAEDLCIYIYSLPLCPHNTVLFECLADLVSSNHGRFAGCFGFDYQRQIWMLRGQNPFVTAVIIRDSPSSYSSCERRSLDDDWRSWSQRLSFFAVYNDHDRSLMEMNINFLQPVILMTMNPGPVPWCHTLR